MPVYCNTKPLELYKEVDSSFLKVRGFHCDEGSNPGLLGLDAL
jgi:hypothetical protein